jgi:imidazolonepropionase-like amidohydrolase
MPFATPDLLAQAADVPLAFTNVTVIDVRDGVARPDMTVVISVDRITAVGQAGSVAVRVYARVVDGTGKYLIPGLWDMHAHTSTDREPARSSSPFSSRTASQASAAWRPTASRRGSRTAKRRFFGASPHDL